MMFVRLFALALVVHQLLYICRDGAIYLSYCFLPTFGLNLGPRQMRTAHLSLIGICIVLAIWPHFWGLYPALLIVLSLIIASYSLRLTNHLVIAWAMSLLLCLNLAFQPPSNWGAELTPFVFAGVQMLIILTYFLAFFHKLNTEWFSRERSCAASLGEVFLRNAGIQNPQVTKLYTLFAIYGTLAVEAVLPLLLLLPHTRPLGLCLAVFFHLPLGLVSALHFSILMYAGLSAFVAPQSWSWVSSSALSVGWPVLLLCLVIGGLVGGRFGLTSIFRHRRAGRLLQMFFGLYTASAIVIAVALLQGGFVHTSKWGDTGTAEQLVLALVGGAFLLNGLGPYLGVKTEFSLAMFSNLRAEPWSHILFPAAWRPFDLSSYVQIELIEGLPESGHHDGGWQTDYVLTLLHKSEHLKYSSYFFHDGLQLICRTVTPTPTVRVTYIENGLRHEVLNYAQEVRRRPPKFLRATLFPFALPIDPSIPHCG